MSPESVVHIIDDDEAVRKSLAFLLGTAELAVRSYDSAVSFLQNTSHVERGCIVTDVRMPEIDGLELLRRVKSLGVGLPVIVITGHGDVALAVEAMKAGAVDFHGVPPRAPRDTNRMQKRPIISAAAYGFRARVLRTRPGMTGMQGAQSGCPEPLILRGRARP